MRCHQLPQRDTEYLAFVRSTGCQVPPCRRAAEAHHAKLSWPPVSEGGMSRKGSDYCAIGLCHEHHMELHQKGLQAFELQHGIDIPRVIVATLIRYIAATRRPQVAR